MTTLITCTGLAVAGVVLRLVRYRRIDSMVGVRVYVALLVVLAVVQRMLR